MTQPRERSDGFPVDQGKWLPYYLAKKTASEIELRNFIGGIAFDSSTERPGENVMAAIEHGTLGNEAKRVRPVLVSLVHDIVEGSYPYIIRASLLPELPHRASLMEDDVDDNAIKRGSDDPAYLKFGVSDTKIACQILYDSPRIILNTLPMDTIQRQNLLSQYTRLSQRARYGQQKDLDWGRGETIPTVDEYLQMCEEKCAAFEYAIRVGAVLGEATEEQTQALVSAGNKTATAFQIVDDLLSLQQESNDYGADLIEKKKTLPVIICVTNQNTPDGIAKAKRLQQIFRLDLHGNPELINEVIEIMNSVGAIGRTREIATTLTEDAKVIIQNAFSPSQMRGILFSIIDYGISRTT